MELQLKNIGMIENANLKIDGLTVIAGENDTGKSTVGKALFCAIKSSAMSDGRFFYVNRNKYIIGKLFGNLKNLISIYSKDSIQYSRLAGIVNDVREDISKLLKKNNRKSVKQQYLEKLKNLQRDEELRKIPLFNEVYKLLEEAIQDTFKNEFTANNFNTIMSYAFSNDFFSHEQNNKKLEISIEDKIKNQKLQFILAPEYNDFSGSKIFDDALYIDTPVIFQLIKLLNDTALADKEYMPTIKDLKQKLLDLPQRVEVWEHSEIQKIADHIKGIIGGDIENKGTEIIYLKKNQTQTIKIENTATGIKSFGLILLLLKQGYIHNKMVLIFDEPEVHLHPKWQLKMAEVIIMLVRFGVKVLVNSHSPYMIQSLIKYSKDKNVVDYSNFYLAKKNMGDSIIENVNDNLDKIFKLLADPMNEVFTL